MGWNNKVTWNEGLFLQPQHFQQQERFIGHQVKQLTVATRAYHWGFNRLVINRDQLAVGKIVIEQASGILPDGTPFSCPDTDPLPQPLDIPEGMQDGHIYIGVMLQRDGAAEVDLETLKSNGTRYCLREDTINDVVSDPKNAIEIQQSCLNLRLLSDLESREDYSCIGVARVRERNADARIILDETYIPPLLDVQVSAQLSGFIQSIAARIDNRAGILADRLHDTAQSGANFAELLQLWQLNRADPLIRHLACTPNLHPEDLFQTLVSLAGELSTFSKANRRVEVFPPYRHDALAETFAPVFSALREAFNMIIDRPAQRIDLEAPRFGIRKAKAIDAELLRNADFHLLVKADMSVEDLRNRFVSQTKVGTSEKIRDLVIAAVPGIGLLLQPVKPAGVTPGYQLHFRLDPQSEWWPEAENPSSFAIHIGAEFPGLDIELWAIRRSGT